MTVFFALLGKLLPLYALAGGGYIAGKFCGVDRKSVAYILFYILSPIVVFHGAYTAGLTTHALLLPAYFFLIAFVISIVVYHAGTYVWRDGTECVLAVGSASSNTGYVGIPVTMAILGEKALPIIVIGTMGLVLFECTMGYFLTARGAYSVKDSIKKLFTVPATYAFALGIAANLGGLPAYDWYTSLMGNIKGAYGTLGIMLIGLGAVGCVNLFEDKKFLLISCLSKIVVWPALAALVIFVDAQTFHALTPDMRAVFTVLSFMPMAANTVVLATLMNVKPEKAAAGVLATSLLSFLTIPLMVTWFGLA
jgi:predicted permease